MHIVVVGIGYVGLATAALWAADHEVTVVDVLQEKVDAVNNLECPFVDSLIEARLEQLAGDDHALKAALNVAGALTDAEMVFIGVPTNYDDEAGEFDIRIADDVFAQVATECPTAMVVMRSTLQPGATEDLAARHGIEHILYCPEFLREGRSLEDCLRPNRVVVGANDPQLANRYTALLKAVYEANDALVPPIVSCSIQEAETAKLFANAYLATRVAFFNELDSFALHRGLDAAKIIQAVCLDERIGMHYNNPSFGYGGYCLPKDTKALLNSFGKDVPHNLIAAIVASNDSRRDCLADRIASLQPRCVGVYRLVAKYGSDNLRSSALSTFVPALVERGLTVVVYEPLVDEEIFAGAPVCRDLQSFFDSCDVIVTNRMSDELANYRGTLFTRDLYNRD